MQFVERLQASLSDIHVCQCVFNICNCGPFLLTLSSYRVSAETQ